MIKVKSKKWIKSTRNELNSINNCMNEKNKKLRS